MQGYIPNPGLKEGTFDSPGLPTRGFLISASVQSTPLQDRGKGAYAVSLVPGAVGDYAVSLFPVM